MQKLRCALLVVATCIVLASALSLHSAAASTRAAFSPTATLDSTADSSFAFEPQLMEVMFVQDSQVRLRGGNLVDFSGSGALDGVNAILDTIPGYYWAPFSEVAESILDNLTAQAELNGGGPVYNLNNAYRLHLPPGYDVWALSAELDSLPGVSYAEPVPLAQEPPSPQDLPGSFVDQQGYLAAAPEGIDAQFAWTKPGGTGKKVTLCDVEYGWTATHPDLTKAPNTQISPNPDSFYPDHGTCVLGELVSDANTFGTTGICSDATLMLAAAQYKGAMDDKSSYNAAGAIALAISKLSAGDVLLLELQWYYGPTSPIPIEWWGTSISGRKGPKNQTSNPVYEAIQLAIKNGINVVEAGGNGDYDVDDLTWLDKPSGATIVGAGGTGDRTKIKLSSYGKAHFHRQGWGSGVVTTGGWPAGNYDLYDNGDTTYTKSFGGTSGASPLVAGAMACCMGFWKASGLKPADLPPPLLRQILIDTGSPQQGDDDSTKFIGPQPNLKAAFAKLSGLMPTATLVAQFTAAASPGGVDLAWNSSAIGAVSAWNLYRATSGSGSYVRLNPAPIPMDGGGEFTWHDVPPAAGRYSYRLAGLEGDGSETVLDAADVQTVAAPTVLKFELAGANPFHGGTMLRYALPTREEVHIEVFDVGGRRVRELPVGEQEPGTYEIPFALGGATGAALRSGIYMVRLRAGAEVRGLRLVALP